MKIFGKSTKTYFLEKFNCEIGEKDVDQMIERLREQNREWLAVERPSQEAGEGVEGVLVFEAQGQRDRRFVQHFGAFATGRVTRDATDLVEEALTTGGGAQVGGAALGATARARHQPVDDVLRLLSPDRVRHGRSGLGGLGVADERDHPAGIDPFPCAREVRRGFGQ